MFACFFTTLDESDLSIAFIAGFVGVVAAPSIIVEEAGGRVTDLEGHRTYAGGNALATNGLLHAAILKRLNQA